MGEVRAADSARARPPAESPEAPPEVQPAPEQPPAEEAAPAGPGLLARALDTSTAAVLSSRYVELKLADLGGSLVLLAQAPVIAFLVGTAFAGGREHARMDLILSLVAVWFGCFNGCREVVKERAIFLRERRAGVSVRGYLLSKLGVLSVLAALQCLALVAVVSLKVTFEGSVPAVFFSLFVTAWAGTCLGLLLSALARTQNALIALVPLALIPQLIFNDVTLGGNASEGVRRIEWLMLGAWGYDALEALRVQGEAWIRVFALDQGAALVLGLIYVLLAGLLLRLAPEE